ncbi:MAG: subclass B3 metallo-beta-lactamase [Verrucomicrobia bacterium 12-59-8]|nr:MAG: subclass B3 metallo-beta-lactamase [Verrucomicrobia bacterium 12-59-8]
MTDHLRSRILFSILLLLGCGLVSAQDTSSWTEPFPPHRIAGNLYYVGSRDLASYLITTPQGHVLINSSLEKSVPLIRASVEKLGFKFTDIRILLISHAHSDHCAGSAEIVKQTGAKYWVMEQDADAVENGGAKKPRVGKGDYTQFPPAKVDCRLKDGEEVKLGDAMLVADLTPGHTPGCTTWAMQVMDNGKSLNAVIIGSPNVNPGYVLVGNKNYPSIAADYEKTFRVLKALPVDLFLGAHASYYGMEVKHALIGQGGVNPFIDPQGFHAYVDDREKAFLTEWEKQKKAK